MDYSDVNACIKKAIEDAKKYELQNECAGCGKTVKVRGCDRVPILCEDCKLALKWATKQMRSKQRIVIEKTKGE